MASAASAPSDDGDARWRRAAVRSDVSERAERVDADADARAGSRSGRGGATPRRRVAGPDAQRALDERDQRRDDDDRGGDGGDGDEPALGARAVASGGGRADAGRAPGCAGAAATPTSPRRAPRTTSWTTASVAAAPMSPSWVARRQISTSIVDVPASPRTRITPNDVNVKTNTIDAAARIAGRSSGRVTRRSDPPRRRAERRRGRLEVGGEVLPHGADGAHDDGEVERDVGGEDRPDAALDGAGRRARKAAPITTVGQHEHRGEQPGQQPPAGEAVAGEHVGRAAARRRA